MRDDRGAHLGDDQGGAHDGLDLLRTPATIRRSSSDDPVCRHRPMESRPGAGAQATNSWSKPSSAPPQATLQIGTECSTRHGPGELACQ